jgi:putative acetyltransferase
MHMLCLEQEWLRVYIRETKDADLEDILLVERQAFNSDKEADLAKDLLADPTAKPLLSLMAFIEDQPAGHILFTKARLLNSPREIAVSFLAPLAVVPTFQRQGVGDSLVKKGLELLFKSGFKIGVCCGASVVLPSARICTSRQTRVRDALPDS